MNKSIRNAGWYGIASLVSSFPTGIVLLLIYTKSISTSYIWLGLFLAIINVALTILFYRGFVLIGRKLKVPMLARSTYFLISMIIVYTLLVAITAIVPHSGWEFLGIIFFAFSVMFSLATGVAIVWFGVSLLKLKDKFGDLATVTGVLNIIAGIFLATVILSFFYTLIGFAGIICEVVLLFKASKKL